MADSTALKLGMLCVLALLSTHVDAERRAIRVDGFGDTWTTFDGQNGDGPGIGSANCPGTSVGSTVDNTLVQFVGHSFSGRKDTAFLVDDYCQVANPGTLTRNGYTYLDERALADLFGSNPDNLITGIRYQMLDQPRFNFPGPTGFQWAFYSFPSGITIAGLYGFANTTLDGRTYISNEYSAATVAFTGQYFCFSGNTYIGSWDGTDPNANCPKAAVGRIFAGEFEP